MATAGEEQESLRGYHRVLEQVFKADAGRRLRSESVTYSQTFSRSRQGMLSESVFKALDAEMDDAEWQNAIGELRVLGGHGLEPEICS